MTETKKMELNRILEKIASALDLTESQYKIIEDRYNAVATHFTKDTSLLKDYEPSIMPQGSFLLGTMVKPIMEDDELDVDLVCRLKRKKDNWAQYHLKQEIKNQIEEDDKYAKMLNKKEGKRCWRIDYAEDTKFHLDILPATISDQHFMLLEKSFSSLTQPELDGLSIRITDNTLENFHYDTNTLNWMPSNPFGYAAWFAERKQTSSQRMLMLNEKYDPLPKYITSKEPLQRVVQILKRHRDIMFGSDEDKPISIIITTLAAKSYNGELNIVDAILNILATMKSHITYEYSINHNKIIAKVKNPVHPEENFADKWPASPEKEDNFNMWLEKARLDFEELRTGDYTQIYRILKSIIGTKVVNEGYNQTGFNSYINENYLPVTFNQNLLTVKHRKQPEWPLSLKYNVEIHGNYKESKFKKTINSNTILPKYCDIFFVATTNTPKPYEVYWQIVNTGNEAEIGGGLRGGIVASRTSGIGGLNQKERSLYKGTHWAECYIVKNGICVARSYEFLVNIE